MDKLWKSYSPKKNLNNFKKASKENDLNLKKYYLNWKKVVDKTIS